MELSEKCVGGSVAKGKRGNLIMQQECSTNYF